MYTIEQLVELTGYAKNTIYTHSVPLSIKPVRGKIKANQGKGLYSEVDLEKLLQYKELIGEGVSKNESYIKVLSCRPQN